MKRGNTLYQETPEPEVFLLGPETIDEVCALETRTYPFPWSDSLIRGEYEKAISLRVGLRLESKIIGYSFNYLVVDELHILNVAIAPEHRHKGFGSLLVQALLDIARARGARYATLEVRMSNRTAQDLYKKFGFVVSGSRPAYYRSNGEDALVMERFL